MIWKFATTLLLGAVIATIAAWQWLPTREHRPQSLTETADLAALRVKITELDNQHKVTSNRLAELEQYMANGNLGIEQSLVEQDGTESEGDTVTDEHFQRVSRNNRSAEQIEASGLSIAEYEAIEAQAQQMYSAELESLWLRRRERFQRGDRSPDSMELLRESAGDDVFDRYLYASGRSNRVKLHRVIQDSAAEQAGLKSGDVVLSYDDKRVFSFKDLKRLSYEGEPGDPVIMRVKSEDGSISQIYLQRGPVDLSGYTGWRETPDR